jgi:hypothetical protein
MMLQTVLLLMVIAGGSASAKLTDASDVLNNLNNYEKLYVSYQNCAWAPYGDQGNNNNNNNNNKNNNNGNACGVQGNNNNYWYMGMTECLRAQVAYSLYGVKKGEEDKGCGKGTFINSFFTTGGLEYFVESMATAGVSFSEADDQADITSDCQQVQNNNNNGRKVAEQENVDYTANNQKINEGASSMGVGCSDKSFALKTYQGAYCDSLSGSEVSDAMSTFNKEISQAQCIVIYDASAAAAAQDDGNNQNNNNNNDGSALTVLQYSQACDVRMFPKQCPDPYGKIHKAVSAQSNSLARSTNPRKQMVKTVFSWLLLGFGIIFWLAAAWAWNRKRTMNNLAENGEKKKRGFFNRNTSKNASQSEKNKSSGKGDGFFARIRGRNTNNES